MLKLMTVDVSSSETKGMGCKEYMSIPRIGEWVDIEVDEVSNIYEVIMVTHPSNGCGSDIYVKHLAETSQAILGLHIKTS